MALKKAKSSGRKRAKALPEKSKVCDACGAANPESAEECAECKGKRFAPSWVRHIRRVNRNFAVQVTDPHELSESKEPRLTLHKWWWPGGRANFNVNTAEQWETVKLIVDTDLAEHLGWKTKQAVRKEIKAQQEKRDSLGAEARALVERDPRLLKEIVQGLRLERIDEEDLPKLGQALGDIARILIGVDESHRLAIRQLVERLPDEGESAIRQLSELMDELTIGQIAAVTSEVQRRVGLLDLFSERVLDERTYELTGDNSIHRLLERAMWIVDERYWLMHSNKQLRTVVTDQLAKEDKAFEAKRPDFVCGTVDRKLIIIEIKRPSHTLTTDDLNQLERYVVICDQYDDSHSSFEAILVGAKASDDLNRTIKMRKESFKIRTYTQLVSDTERRYKNYLDALGEAQSEGAKHVGTARQPARKRRARRDRASSRASAR